MYYAQEAAPRDPDILSGAINNTVQDYLNEPYRGLPEGVHVAEYDPIAADQVKQRRYAQEGYAFEEMLARGEMDHYALRVINSSPLDHDSKVAATRAYISGERRGYYVVGSSEEAMKMAESLEPENSAAFYIKPVQRELELTQFVTTQKTHLYNQIPDVLSAQEADSNLTRNIVNIDSAQSFAERHPKITSMAKKATKIAASFVSPAVLTTAALYGATNLANPEKTEASDMNPDQGDSAAEGQCTTTAGSLRFRREPNTNTDANIITTLPLNTPLEFDGERNGDWLKVKHAGNTGWVHSGYVNCSGDVSSVTPLVPPPAPGNTLPQAGSPAIGAPDGRCAIPDVRVANVRQGPSTNTPVIGSATRGQALPTNREDVDGWASITLNGIPAWISEDVVIVGSCSTPGIETNHAQPQGTNTISINAHILNFQESIHPAGTTYIWPDHRLNGDGSDYFITLFNAGELFDCGPMPVPVLAVGAMFDGTAAPGNIFLDAVHSNSTVNLNGQAYQPMGSFNQSVNLTSPALGLRDVANQITCNYPGASLVVLTSNPSGWANGQRIVTVWRTGQ